MVNPTRDISETSLSSVADLITQAFGGENAADRNIVNFKLIHALLLILSKKLKLLDRKIVIDFSTIQGLSAQRTFTVMTLTSIRVTAKDKKNIKKLPEGKEKYTVQQNIFDSDMTFDKTSSKISSSDKTSSKDTSDKTTPGQTPKSSKSRNKSDEEFSRSSTDKSGTSCTKYKAKTGAVVANSKECSDIQHENIFIIEKLPVEMKQPETFGIYGRIENVCFVKVEKTQVAPQSLVTKEEFLEVADDVVKLQERFGLPSDKGLGLMEALRRSASLSDPVAIIQLSGRLEAVEKVLEEMLPIVKEVVDRAPGFGQRSALEMEVTKSSQQTGKESKSFKSAGKTVETHEITSSQLSGKDNRYSIITDAKTRDLITYGELRDRMKELEEHVRKAIAVPTGRAVLIAENAIKAADKLNIELGTSLEVGDKMAYLEEAVSEYAERVTNVDAQFSTLMTTYQEELSQMQHDLEKQLDDMAEALAHQDTDTGVITELNNRFTSLHADIEQTTGLQKDLQNGEEVLNLDLDSIRKRVQALGEQKSDRDEVAEALNTKAGLTFLNGMISYPQFEAVRGDLQKQIASSFDKFNSQESSWQKVIDELMRNLYDRAESFQLTDLKKNIDENIDILKKKLDFMLDVCGTLRVSDNERQVFRDEACLCCSTAAADAMGEPFKRTTSTQQNQEKDDAGKKSKEEGDGDVHRPCIPNIPIPHSLDKRAFKCPRYCGHALAAESDSDRSEGIKSSINVQPLEKIPKLKPKLRAINVLCIPCNTQKKNISFTPNPGKGGRTESVSINTMEGKIPMGK